MLRIEEIPSVDIDNSHARCSRRRAASARLGSAVDLVAWFSCCKNCNCLELQCLLSTLNTDCCVCCPLRSLSGVLSTAWPCSPAGPWCARRCSARPPWRWPCVWPTRWTSASATRWATASPSRAAARLKPSWGWCLWALEAFGPRWGGRSWQLTAPWILQIKIKAAS